MSVNPGPGGWAFYVPSTGQACSGGASETTNNRMELQAVIELLKAVPGPLRIVTDSQYVIGMANGWRARANIELVLELRRRVRTHGGIEWTWVRGHAGVEGNERVDAMAEASLRPSAPRVDHSRTSRQIRMRLSYRPRSL